MEINWIALLVSALATLIIGFFWYSDAVFGKIWMREAGLTKEQLEKGSMLKIFVLTIFYSILITFMVQVLVIHQFGAYGMIGGAVENAKPSYTAFMSDYGTAFRTYKHGALHGFLAGLFLALPMIAINSLFERKSWKYILIHGGYWVVTFTVMGAIIGGWV